MDDLLQATDDKHLIFKDKFERNGISPLLHTEGRHEFWAKRYLCIHRNHDKDDEFWRLDIFDLLTKDSKSMRFQKSSNQFRFVHTYFLNHKFMLVVESSYQMYRVNLVKLNWEFDVLKTLEHFERNSFFWYTIADTLNQSKFVLLSATWPMRVFEYQECKLINGKIKFGTMHQLSGNYSQCLNNKLIKVNRLNRKFRIKMYNMIDNQEKTFETEVCPDHVELVAYSLRKWIGNRMYAAIYFQDSGNYGLMWTDAEIRRWNILDFSTNIAVCGLHFFDSSLIVRTKQVGKENGVFKSIVKVYGIDIHHPQPLRQKAWSVVIRNLKSEGNLDPYKEAARYLPFNSDLRPHWFEDKEDEAKSDEGKNSDENEAIPLKRRKPN